MNVLGKLDPMIIRATKNYKLRNLVRMITGIHISHLPIDWHYVDQQLRHYYVTHDGESLFTNGTVDVALRITKQLMLEAFNKALRFNKDLA